MLLLALACVSSRPEPVVEARPAALDIPGLDVEAPVATWSAEEAVAAVETALAGDFPSPLVVRESLQEWFGHGDAICPGEGMYTAGPAFEGCTSGEGWYYLGVGGYVEAFFEDEGGRAVELSVMGDLTIVEPEGGEIDLGGHWLTVLREEGPAWSAVLNGSWREPRHAADWLAGGMSAWLTYAGSVREDGHTVTLDGGLTLRGTTLGFDGVTLGSDGCEGVPAGAVTVLDPGGGTWSVDFGAACARCGSVAFEGTPAETEACLVLEGLGERIVEASTP